MKKIIFIIFALFLIIFLIGIFVGHKENIIKIIKNEQNLKNNTISPSTLMTAPTLVTSTIDQSTLAFALELQKQINQEVNKLTENLKPDANKSLSQYKTEMGKIHLKLESTLQQGKINPTDLINFAQDLASIQPPSTLYQFHLELIKTYYALGLAFQQFQQTDDPIKKMLLYNLIKTTLEKIKF
jgi:hypothetical protein